MAPHSSPPAAAACAHDATQRQAHGSGGGLRSMVIRHDRRSVPICCPILRFAASWMTLNGLAVGLPPSALPTRSDPGFLKTLLDLSALRSQARHAHRCSMLRCQPMAPTPMCLSRMASTVSSFSPCVTMIGSGSSVASSVSSNTLGTVHDWSSTRPSVRHGPCCPCCPHSIAEHLHWWHVAEWLRIAIYSAAIHSERLPACGHSRLLKP